MAQSTLTLDENPSSPDLFSDSELESQNLFDSAPLDEAYPVVVTSEPELVDDTPQWKGVSMDEIHKGLGPFGYQQHPPIRPSEFHTVLFQVPVPNRGVPKPYPTHPNDKWGVGYVRMPNSANCRYPIEAENKPRELRVRWEVIQEALLQSFMSSTQLEAAILSYNSKYAERWDFSAMHHFFTEVIDEEEAEMFFEKLLPKMVQLALQLPTLITGPIPLLLRHKNSTISLSQLQVASLLANAFFCTFPRRNSFNPQAEYGKFPHINFNCLFSAYEPQNLTRSSVVDEKLKCIFHYFRRVTTAAPEGTITIQRRYIAEEACPKWDQMHNLLPPLHITSKGTIETEGAGLLQVDFANKFVGGGVLRFGCVQEEIRFVICPELLVTMLVAEVLDDTEALVISGVERYSSYEGYGNTFKWGGNFVDETPRDNSGRRKTSVLAIDALRFHESNTQFEKKNLTRELNKAYVGFSSSEMSSTNLSAIASGNWGCGAFRGNPQLKVLIQLMAAAVVERPMVYFTFGDKDLRDSVAEMYWHLLDRNIDVARLFVLLSAYDNKPSSDHSNFYNFLYNRSKMKPLTHYFSVDNIMSTITKPSVKKSKSPENSKKTVTKLNKDEKCVKKVPLTDEIEEERIGNLIENYDDTATTSTKETEALVEPAATKKKSLWDIFAEKEAETDRIRDKSTYKRFTALDIISTKPIIIDESIVNNNSVESENPPSPEKTVKSKNKSSTGQAGGQKKIKDFFSRKN